MKTLILLLILAVISFVGMFVLVLYNYFIVGLISGLLSLIIGTIALIKTLCLQNKD